MTAVRVLSGTLGDEQRRESVYGGDLLVFQKIPPMEEFCAFTDTLIREVFGTLGHRARLEIVRRFDNRLPHLRPDAHRDHILLDVFADSNAGIETLANDVRQSLVSHKLHLDVGVATHNLR